MAKRTIGKPMFYADVLQYIKAIGKYQGSDEPELFNFDPTNDKEYTFASSEDSDSKFATFTTTDQEGAGGALAQLIEEGSNIYSGFIGHSVSYYDTDGYLRLGVKALRDTGTYAGLQFSSTKAINYTSAGALLGTITKKGYSIWRSSSGFNAPISGNELNLYYNTVNTYGGELKHNLGAFTFGKYYQPEHSFELQATISDQYEGIKTQNTIGGHTITNINHLGQPNWGNGLPAWTIAHDGSPDYDYDVGGRRGRRQWSVGLSYLDDDKIFHKHTNHNQFFENDWNDLDYATDYVLDDTLAGFFKLTLNGQIPFIFTPDASLSNPELAICRITNKPSFKQVANNLFSTSLVITETW